MPILPVMSRVLALDVGSSSVKAAALEGARVVGGVARVEFPTRFAADRAEIRPTDLFAAVAQAVNRIGRIARRCEFIALAALGPSWVAIDARGRSLTPIVTHQDRRSVAQARFIEDIFGASRHLRIVGARPFPGGISSTTCRWFGEHHASLLRRADLIGHVPTLLHRAWCGTRVIDTSHASFTGLFRTTSLKGWDDELCELARVRPSQLPRIVQANDIGGRLSRSAAAELGLPAGMPMLAGIMDGSVPMLLAGARPGRIVNVIGTTDVLAVCVDRPRPHPLLLTRALGIGKLWLAVSTMAAGGATIGWLRDTFFADLSDAQFHRAVRTRAREHGLTVAPFLAGSRVSIEQRSASFSGLTLSTSRTDLLHAAITALAAESAARVRLLRELGIGLDRQVLVAGGERHLNRIMHARWPGRWRFRSLPGGTIAGLGTLAAEVR